MNFICKVTNGKIPIEKDLEILKFLKLNNGKNIRIEIINSDLRSNKLNAYYWGIFLPTLCSHWAKQYNQLVSSDWMNELLKKEFCFYVKDGVKHVLSTKKMKVSQMLGFFKHVDMWSFEQFGKGIPKPNDVIEWNESFV